MLHWLGNLSRSRSTALQLYGSSVAQARLPVFYRDFCVADTFSGRFELVMLHTGLLVRRLTAEGKAGAALGQAVVERMFGALDDDMREIGVGDLSVPKRVHAAASSFYGRLKAYDAALALADETTLAGALGRNLPASQGRSLQTEGLARYVRDAAAQLEAQSYTELVQGRVRFPQPKEFAT
jgi:cytochrome b pre-mRNA-processing protein 3